MYSILQVAIDDMKPALLEMPAVLEAIICPCAPNKPVLLEMRAVLEAIIRPYAPNIVKIDFYVMNFVKSNDFKEPKWIIFIYYLISSSKFL